MIGAFAGVVDTFFQRILVEPWFVPRSVEQQVSWLEDARARLLTLSPEELFVSLQSANLVVTEQGRYRGTKTQMLSWDTLSLPAYELFGLRPRTTAPRATLFGDGGRPLWILVHGWLGGSRFMDEIYWPLRPLLRTHDVALLILPGHGSRSVPRYSALPSFPCRNPIRNVLGLLTAVTELGQLLRWLKARGYGSIGVAGSSLGVQIAALGSTLEGDVSRWLFDRPLAELSSPLRRRVERDRPDLRGLLEALQGLYRPVNPLSCPSRISPHQVDVLLGREDRVAGRQEGEALARHFGVAPQTFPTGHVLSLGREAMVLQLLQKL